MTRELIKIDKLSNFLKKLIFFVQFELFPLKNELSKMKNSDFRHLRSKFTDLSQILKPSIYPPQVGGLIFSLPYGGQTAKRGGQIITPGGQIKKNQGVV